MSDFFSSTTPRARRPYRCEWCGETIVVGERHYRYSGKWEGEFQFYRMHNECYSVMCRETDDGEGFSPFENERPEIEVLVACPS